MYGSVNTCWLTLNRACNLACKWCYAKNANIKTMTIEDALSVISFLDSVNIRNLTLIGGEPTIYKNLPQILLAANTKKIRAGIVTNGIALKNREYLHELRISGLHGVGLSVKGYDQKSFIDTTEVDGYNDVMEAITNLSMEHIPFSVSYVMTPDNIDKLHLAVKDAVKNGAASFRFSFCYDFEACRQNTRAIENPYSLAKQFSDNYNKLHEACGHTRMTLFQSLPLCVWNKEFINLLEQRNEISSGCQVLSKSGLIFDTDLSIIPCNAMYDYKIGQFGIDFSDAPSFEKYWNSEPINEFYNRLRAYPSKTCSLCDSFGKCGGGCVSNWFNYSFNDLQSMKGGA